MDSIDDVATFSQLSLSTSEITLLSHTHGRERRATRGIMKDELKAAIKYGKKERAHPGTSSAPRWRFTHCNVVYITDESCRHEITSWRIDDELQPPALPVAQGEFSSHTVFMVDKSGSMRKSDVLGYDTRTQAVYECLAKEFVQPQLLVPSNLGTAVVSLIEMGNYSTVVFERTPISTDLLKFLSSKASSRAAYHGNYLPALDALTNLLLNDLNKQVQLFVIFLSDGAPSDHIELVCEHGVSVWKSPDCNFFGANLPLQNCMQAQVCRANLQERVKLECISKIRFLGESFGRDRIQLHTVAFGPPSENYTVLQEMAKALPRSSFQKLGLAVIDLKTAFTSLTSSLTSLRTVGGGDEAKKSLTKRFAHSHSLVSSSSNMSTVLHFSLRQFE